MQRLALLIALSFTTTLFATKDLALLTEKIWQNECGGSVEKLVYWNPHEGFPSLGIGHFIWFPEGKEFPYEETFPQLMTYLKKEGYHPPEWLQKNPSLPWKDRQDFIQSKNSQKIQELRTFLYNTRCAQCQYIAERAQKTLPTMLDATSRENRNKVKKLYLQLSESANGQFALIDYVNFKGDGTSSKERYNGVGWGLLQVLEKMPYPTKAPLEAFIVAAKQVLDTRIASAPREKSEERWRQGWHNRIDSYR